MIKRIIHLLKLMVGCLYYYVAVFTGPIFWIVTGKTHIDKAERWYTKVYLEL